MICRYGPGHGEPMFGVNGKGGDGGFFFCPDCCYTHLWLLGTWLNEGHDGNDIHISGTELQRTALGDGWKTLAALHWSLRDDLVLDVEW